MEKEIMYLENLRSFIYAIDKESGDLSSIRTNIFLKYIQLISERIEIILEVDKFLTKTELTKDDPDFLIPNARTIYELVFRFYSLFGMKMSEGEFDLLLAWWRIKSDDNHKKFTNDVDEKEYREIIAKSKEIITTSNIFIQVQKENQPPQIKRLQETKFTKLPSTTILFIETIDNKRVIVPRSITLSYDYIVNHIVTDNKDSSLEIINSRFQGTFNYLSRFSHSSYDTIFNFALHTECIETYKVKRILAAVIDFSIVIVLTAAYNLFPKFRTIQQP